MSNLSVREIKAFIPARDFDLSKRFYQALGFTLRSDSNGVAYFLHDDSSFLLQDYYVKEMDSRFISLRKHFRPPGY